MDIFYGQPVRAGSALASAALVRTEYGLSMLSAERMRRVTEQILRDPTALPESEDVVLVAAQPPLALLAEMVSGYEMRGLALTDDAPPDFESPVPCVAGLGDAFQLAVAEHDLVIVDGASGRVFLSPDAPTVARFQAPPRIRRYHLDPAHLPAKTQSDNRIVGVYAAVCTQDDIDTAMQHGADGLLLTSLCPLLIAPGESPSASAQQRALQAIVGITGGAPIAIGCAPDDLALSNVMRTAAQTPIFLTAPAGDVEPICAEVESVQSLADPDEMLATPGLWLRIAPGDDFDPEGPVERCAGLLLERPLGEYPGDVLLPALAYARRAGLSAAVRLDSDATDDDLEDAVRFEIHRVVVRPDQVDTVKDQIRVL